MPLRADAGGAWHLRDGTVARAAKSEENVSDLKRARRNAPFSFQRAMDSRAKLGI
jgi:hypothetical protein